jgi:hypothetical protein
VRRAAVVLFVWGLWLAVLTGVQVVFAPKLIQFAIPAVASAACVLVGLAVWALDVRQGDVDEPRLITDSSVATVALVLGAAVALIGAGFGLWLILIGVGIVALGLGGVIREQRGRSRALRRECSR